MAPKRTRRARFDYAQIVERIEEAREKRGRSTKALGEAVGLSGSAWYRKLHRRGSTFTLEEFGSIAEALDAPEGWPFVEWRA